MRSKLASGNGSFSASPYDQACHVGWCFAHLDHGAEHGVNLGQGVGVVVEGDDVGAAPSGLVAVASGTGPDIEKAVAGLQIQPVEVDGQHLTPRRGVVWVGLVGVR